MMPLSARPAVRAATADAPAASSPETASEAAAARPRVRPVMNALLHRWRPTTPDRPTLRSGAASVNGLAARSGGPLRHRHESERTGVPEEPVTKVSRRSHREHVGPVRADARGSALAFVKTQRCGSAEPRQPLDDRIPGERSSQRAPSRRSHWRRSVGSPRLPPSPIAGRTRRRAEFGDCIGARRRARSRDWRIARLSWAWRSRPAFVV